MLGVGGWKGSNVYMSVAVIVVVAEERDGGEQIYIYICIS